MNHLLADAVNVFFTALYIMLFVRIILSWFPMRNSRFMDLLFAFTEPVLAPVRKLVQRSPLGGPGMVLDFSPLIVFLLLRLANGIIVPFLRGL
ncbi:MAG: YggT family protein [Defluviitaleaceae bacterium]|nr:YggT family protein [Defluviitaleaceae bacterium]MCL2262836.1 YggT family protein [Defluviitaleaceae bacterium]